MILHKTHREWLNRARFCYNAARVWSSYQFRILPCHGRGHDRVRLRPAGPAVVKCERCGGWYWKPNMFSATDLL